MNKRQIQLISFSCGKNFVVRGSSVVVYMIIWSIVGCSIVFLAISSTIPKIFVTSFSLPLSPQYNPSKALLIIYVYIAFLVVENLRILTS